MLTCLSDQSERNKEVQNLFGQELKVLYTFISLLYEELSKDLLAVGSRIIDGFFPLSISCWFSSFCLLPFRVLFMQEKFFLLSTHISSGIG